MRGELQAGRSSARGSSAGQCSGRGSPAGRDKVDQGSSSVVLI